mmetsp:Transcript_30098/g.64508  ORF Transcript_30098/g.64508 Transcript_30098/m.64508 type:complete len:242 (-) Transcript_30098:1328-2053(-)
MGPVLHRRGQGHQKLSQIGPECLPTRLSGIQRDLQGRNPRGAPLRCALFQQPRRAPHPPDRDAGPNAPGRQVPLADTLYRRRLFLCPRVLLAGRSLRSLRSLVFHGRRNRPEPPGLDQRLGRLRPPQEHDRPPVPAGPPGITQVLGVRRPGPGPGLPQHTAAETRLAARKAPAGVPHRQRRDYRQGQRLGRPHQFRALFAGPRAAPRRLPAMDEDQPDRGDHRQDRMVPELGTRVRSARHA